jgi:chloride channel 7
MPGAIVLGITGGCLGALFINVNTRVNAYRKVLLTSKWIKPIETLIFAFLSASIFFYVPSKFRDCQNTEEVVDDTIELQKAWC